MDSPCHRSLGLSWVLVCLNMHVHVQLFCTHNINFACWKCNFPTTTPQIRLLVGWFSFLKVREDKLPSSFRSSCCIYYSMIKIFFPQIMRLLKILIGILSISKSYSWCPISRISSHIVINIFITADDYWTPPCT